MALVSPTHGLIFIKTTKTAGTSIEVDLSPHLGPDAIVTPIIPAVPGHEPRNFARDGDDRHFFNHMPAVTLRNRLGHDTYDRMLSFCVEREPVSKCISHFHMLRNSDVHRTKETAGMSWADYVERGKFPVDLARYTTLRDDGRRVLLVDRVLRYDHLPTAVETLTAEVGIEGFRLTSLEKSEYSRRRLVTPQDVTPAQRRRIEAAFAKTTQTIGIDWQAP